VALTARKVQTAKKPGRYRDETIPGLYLQITRDGVKSWLLRFEQNGRERWHGLGPCHTVTLAEARERARQARLKLLDGIDPIEAKKAQRAAAALEAAKAMTFEQAAQAYNDQNEGRWRNRKSAGEFLRSLRAYAYPVIGQLPVGAIDTGLVLKVLERRHPNHPSKTLWQAIPETADRIRNRIERVLDWATARGYREGDNPARWKGHLETVLPARSAIQRAQNHPALPYSEIPAFMAKLRERDGVAARALEFLILTAARSGEVLGATWGEIDLVARTWTVPANRIKGGREHRVPLSDRAAEILQMMPRQDGNDHVFIGTGRTGGLSHTALSTELERTGRKNGETVHGFRSTFRTWASESTSYPHEVCEAALAHVIPDAVVRAYQRTDLFDKRRKLMTDWARYTIGPVVGGVVLLQAQS